MGENSCIDRCVSKYWHVSWQSYSRMVYMQYFPQYIVVIDLVFIFIFDGGVNSYSHITLCFFVSIKLLLTITCNLYNLLILMLEM